MGGSDFPTKRFTLTTCDRRGNPVWRDEQNVCNQERLQVVLAELTKRGFNCAVVRSGNDLGLDVGGDKNGGQRGQVPVQLAGVEVLGGRIMVANIEGGKWFHGYPGGMT